MELNLFYELNRDAAIEMSYKPRPSYIARCKELKIHPPKVFYDPKIRSLHPWLARRPRSIARLSIFLALDGITKENSRNIFDLEKIREKVRSRYPPLISYTKSKPFNKEIVLCDPMAGGGSIPLESVLLGIRTIAFDYNPVAYLVLKGCIEYPLRFKEELSKAVKDEANRIIRYAQNKLGKFYGKRDDAYIFTKSVVCPFCKKELPLVSGSIEVEEKARIIKKARNSLKIRCGNCNINFEIDKYKLLRDWVGKQTRLLSHILSGEVDHNLVLSTHPILIKKDVGGRYVASCEEDNKLLLNACDFLANRNLKECIPTDQIPNANRVFSPLVELGIKYWYQIFNPRQLLALTTLTEYVRKRYQELISKDGEFGAAIALYLSFGLSKMVDFNTVLTTWNATNKSIRDTVGQYARSRKVELNLEYCEAVVPYKNLPWVFEPNAASSTGGGICPVVEELCRQMADIKTSIKVLQFDAKKVSLLGEKIDLINVDPPYFDQHIYSDFSEFFWMVLRNCLKDAIGEYLFNEEINGRKSWEYLDWNPKLPYVPRKDELIVRRSQNPVEVEEYKKNLTEFFRSAYNALKDDGKLVLWFTHRAWKAWESVLYSLYVSGFKVVKFYPFVSEHPTRSVTMQGEPKLNRTVVIVAVKNFKPVKNLEEDVFNFCSEVYEYLNHAKIMPNERIYTWEKALTLIAASTARLTILNRDRKGFESEILPKGMYLGMMSLLKILSREKGLRLTEVLNSLDNVDRAKLFLHVLYRLFGDVKVDLAKYVCELCGVSLHDLISRRDVIFKKQTIKPLKANEKILEVLKLLEDVG